MRSRTRGYVPPIDPAAPDFDEKLDIIRRLAPAHGEPSYMTTDDIQNSAVGSPLSIRGGQRRLSSRKLLENKLNKLIANGKTGNLHVEKLKLGLNFKREDFSSDEEWLLNRDFALGHDEDHIFKASLRKLAVDKPRNPALARLMARPVSELRRALQSSDLNTNLPAACYTSVKYNDKNVGQLIGDCLNFNPSVPLAAPITVTFKVLPDI
jgi:hypothetical protein